MKGKPRVGEQHIAVFGGSGSGKTVLISSFFGAAQEQAFLKSSLYHVIADDTGQGHRLRQNYLRMKNDAKAPDATRFAATPFSFRISFQGTARPQDRPGTILRRLATCLARLPRRMVRRGAQ